MQSLSVSPFLSTMNNACYLVSVIWRFATRGREPRRQARFAESYVDFTICLSERRGCRDAPRDHVSWNVTYVSRDAPKTTDERRQRESSRNRGTATATRGRGVTRQTQGMRCVNQSVTIERRKKKGERAAGICTPWSEIQQRQKNVANSKIWKKKK